ncbi:MAG: MerR family transcriptional regulator [Actinomycetota bacterium]
MDGLFSIGEFSRMSWLTVKALRLYDEEGILKPGFVDPSTGYRYYSSIQLPEARTVRLLRSLDMPLEEVREFLKETSPGARTKLLERHRDQLESRLESYRAIISSIDDLTERKGEAMGSEVETKDLANQPVLSIRFKTSMAGIGDAVGVAFGKIFGYLGQTGTPPAGPPFALYYDMEMKEEDIDMEICVPVSGETEGAGEVVGRVVPGGSAVSTMHAGPYDQVGGAYEALMTWMKENGYEPAGPAREVYLVGPDKVQDPAEYRTEVLIPARKQ